MEISGEQAYLFRHALVREAAYALQIPSERASLHAIALDILEGIVALNRRALGLELAHHARMAAPVDAARYARAEREYLKLGGDYARFNYDYPGAQAALERLLELTETPAERAVAADMLADVMQRLGRWADSLQYFEIVRRDAADPELRGRALVHLAWVGLDMGRDVDDLAAEGEALAEASDSHRLRIAFMLLRARRVAEQGGDTAPVMARAIEYAKATNDGVQLMIAHLNAAQYALHAGRLAEAAAQLDVAEALASAPDMRHHRISIVLARAELAIKTDAFEDTLRSAQEAAAIGSATGSRGLVGSALVNMAVALTGLGRHAEAQSRLEDARPIMAETGDAALAASWLKALSELMRARGRPAEALPELQQGLRDLQGRVPAATLEMLHEQVRRCEPGVDG